MVVAWIGGIKERVESKMTSGFSLDKEEDFLAKIKQGNIWHIRMVKIPAVNVSQCVTANISDTKCI